MISTVRIPGDFLLTEYKDAVWQKIEDWFNNKIENT